MKNICIGNDFLLKEKKNLCVDCGNDDGDSGKGLHMRGEILLICIAFLQTFQDPPLSIFKKINGRGHLGGRGGVSGLFCSDTHPGDQSVTVHAKRLD